MRVDTTHMYPDVTGEGEGEGFDSKNLILLQKK